MKRFRLAAASAVLFAALLLAYSNHFSNGFHFDDFHTVVRNPAIRTFNLHRFWTDAGALSTEPQIQNYRPLLVTSLALDYRLAGGAYPFWFHVSTFVWFIVLLVCLYLLCERIFPADPPIRRAAALFTAALFGLHPAGAETVNYIVQRADLFVALGIVAGVVLYARAPGLRRFGLYLLPPLAGLAAKAPAAVFAPMLLVYILLFEPRGSRPALRGLARSLPAFATCIAGLVFLQWMTPATFLPSNNGFSEAQYRITQPYVALRYFRTFFFPLHLSGDTDLRPFNSILDPLALAGVVFLLALLAAAILAGRSASWRPVSLGLWWFLLGLFPTSFYALGELENDHRAFLPFIGLAIAVVWCAVLLLRLEAASAARRAVAAGVAVMVLAAAGFGVHQRNRVWHDDLSFWGDVVAKSPNNGRGYVNHAFALIAAGRPQQAWPELERASSITAFQSMIQVGFALSGSALHHPDAEVEDYFHKAMSMDPTNYAVCRYYAQWLLDRGRTTQAAEMFAHAVALNGNDVESLRALLPLYRDRKDWQRLQSTASQLSTLLPGDAEALQSLSPARQHLQRIAAAERAVADSPTAASYLNLAAVYLDERQFSGARSAAARALQLDPQSAEARRILAQAGRNLE